MKHRYQKIYLAFIALFCSLTFSFAQNGISFQGALYENGEAVNGAVDITFSILSPVWTETHQSVQVVQGLYSVTLGLENAFPDDLFLTGTPELKISVGGTEIATVALHAPYISRGIVAKNMPDSINGVFDTDDSEHNTIIFTVSGTGTGANAAIEAVAQTTDRNIAIEGFSQSQGPNTQRQTGMYGQASGDGSGDHRGIVGVAIGGGKYNKGLYGYAEGQGNGDVGQGFGEGSINFGVEGNATGNAFNNTGLEGSNFGESGVWNFGVHGISNAGTDSTENHGVAGKAFGPGINYGVHGTADGGVENWAGYFEGDVNVNGQLMVNGAPMGAPRSVVIEEADADGDTVFHYQINADNVVRGIQVDMTGAGTKYAFRGNTTSSAGDTGWKVGAITLASGDGDGDHTGVYGQAFGPGKYNNGITGVAGGAGNGETGYGTGSYNVGALGIGQSNPWGNVGVEGRAVGNAGVDNIGVIGLATAGDSTDTSIENKAVLGRAEGKGINKAIVGMASGGVENWAGWFEGDVQVNGNLAASTLTSDNGTVQTSDKRFKKNVKSIENALSKTSQLNGYTYNWNKLAKKQKGITSDEEQLGVLAQELEEVFPQLVKTDKEGYKAVNYAALTAVLIEAVKELSAEVNALKTENAQLKSEFSRVASLEAKINLIEKLLTEKNKSDELETASK